MIDRNIDDFDNDAHVQSVVVAYGKALVHLRQQIEESRFGIVFGAGASIDIKFPSWKDLLARISEDGKVNGQMFLATAKNFTSLSQCLFEHFLAQRSPPNDTYDGLQAKKSAQRDWLAIIRECLYRDTPNTVEEIEALHPFLWAYIDLIRNTRVTVNYNFDDTIERLLESTRSTDEKAKGRGFTAVWDSNVLNIPRKAVIYHPNGFLPSDATDRGSEHLIFLEDSFGDQLISSMAGHYSALSAHYEQNTCLFIGLSLEDPTLKHLLRKSAVIRPGHFHYFVHWIESHNAVSDDYKTAITQSNFHTYNIVTLFLTSDEIATLGKLLVADGKIFKRLLGNNGLSDTIIYYVTGCVSAGKTTAIDNLRSFIGFGEWTERLLPTMRKSPELLLESEEKKIDQWVVDQYRKKNERLSSLGPGIYIIDRAFLDAFAFIRKKKTDNKSGKSIPLKKPEVKKAWKEKANNIRTKLTPSGATVKSKITPGHVILLMGDPRAMSSRGISMGKNFSHEDSEEQQNELLYIYKELIKEGVSVVDTRGLSSSDVAKEVGKLILLGTYQVCELDACLSRIEQKGR